MNIQEQLSHYGLSADQVLDMAGQIAADNFKREDSPPLTSIQRAGKLFWPYLAGRAEEIFAAAFLDTKHRLIKLETLFRGTIDRTVVHPRVVAERALRCGAAAVIVAHNHPSGDPEPSEADRAITRRLKSTLALLDIRLLDHVVVGNDGVCSTDHAKRRSGSRRNTRNRLMKSKRPDQPGAVLFDAEGAKFDPGYHCLDENGNPRMNKSGTFRRRPQKPIDCVLFDDLPPESV